MGGVKTGWRDAQYATLVKTLCLPPRWMTVNTQDSQRKDPPGECQGKVVKAPSIDPPEGHPEDTAGHTSKRMTFQHCDGRRGLKPPKGGDASNRIYGQNESTGYTSGMTEYGWGDNQKIVQSVKKERTNERRNWRRSKKNKTPSLRSKAADVNKERKHLPKKMKSAGTVEITAENLTAWTLEVNQARQCCRQKTDAKGEKTAYEIWRGFIDNGYEDDPSNETRKHPPDKIKSADLEKARRRKER
jgi:hypothetical protein